MISKFHAPGLVRRKNGDETYRYYWIAGNCARDTMGFEPATVRLHYESDAERADACCRLSGELAVWIEQRKNPDKTLRPKVEKVRFTGTPASMIDVYELHPLSPFHQLQPKTQRGYIYDMAVLRRRVGKRKLAAISGEDLLRWHQKFIESAASEKRDGIRYAHGLMTMLRTVLRFGARLGYEQAKRLTDVLMLMRFKMPKPRKTILTLEHAKAVIAEALERGRDSIALGQALQFELTLRQYDVIGQWEPLPPGAEASGITFRGKIWRKGLTWNLVDDDLVLTVLTSKREVEAVYDLKLYPMVMAELERIPADKRVGPMIIDEDAGRPYLADRYARVWWKDRTGCRHSRRCVEPRQPHRRCHRGNRCRWFEGKSRTGAASRRPQQHRNHAALQPMTLDKTSNAARLRTAHRERKNTR